MRYKASSNMLETFKVNFPRKYKNKPLTCDHCEKVKGPNSEPKDAHEKKAWDSQRHVLTACPEYTDIRLKHDLQTDIGITHFFREVIDRRLADER